MRLRNVIFDLDGTLVDSLPGIEYAVDCALEAKGYPQRTQDLKPLIGPPIRKIFEALTAESDPHAMYDLEGAFRAAYDSEGWRRTRLQPDAKETLRWIADLGARSYVVTNKPLRPAAAISESLGLPSLLAAIISPDSASPPYRSKAEMIAQLMQDGCIRAGNSLVVGDTFEDVEAAYQAGLPAVVVANGYGPKMAYPCRRIEALGQLKSVIDETGGFA